MNILPSIKFLFNKYLSPILFVIAGGILFYFCPLQFVPDYLNIKDYPKINELFHLIITSLVSLIGIYISVSLVAYEFFKQKSGINFHKSFLVNRINSSFISISIGTIIVAFTCSILISGLNPNYHEVSIIYYNIILFIFVILLLFPVAFNLFSSLKPEKLAHEELSKINKETIFIRTAETGDIDKQAEIFENDHLVRIENIVIALISVSDNIKAQAIIQKVTVKMSNLIIDEEIRHEKEYIIERLISFYIKIIDFSLLQPNNTAILRSIWIAVERMYSIIIERKETSIHYEKFRKQFFERFFNRLFENKKEEIIFEGIATIRNIIQEQVLLNMVDEKQIYHLNDYRRKIEKDFKEPKNLTDEDFRNAEHWREIASETMNCFTFLITKAIKLNQPDLINKCFEQINELNFKFYLKKIGVYTQSFFLIHSANIICDYTYRAFEKKVFLEGLDAKYLTPSLFINLIEGKHPAARTVLQKYCYLLINLQTINKLDRWFLGGLTIGDFITTEGELGGIAKRCAIKFSDGKEIQDCLEDCINAFIILKESFEKNLPENFDLYLVIKWQFENILEFLKRAKVDNDKIINQLNDLITSFQGKNSH